MFYKTFVWVYTDREQRGFLLPADTPRKYLWFVVAQFIAHCVSTIVCRFQIDIHFGICFAGRFSFRFFTPILTPPGPVGEVWNRTINVNFRKNNHRRPRPGRFGWKPNRILQRNPEDFKNLFSPVGFICLGISSVSV